MCSCVTHILITTAPLDLSDPLQTAITGPPPVLPNSAAYKAEASANVDESIVTALAFSMQDERATTVDGAVEPLITDEANSVVDGVIRRQDFPGSGEVEVDLVSPHAAAASHLLANVDEEV